MRGDPKLRHFYRLLNRLTAIVRSVRWRRRCPAWWNRRWQWRHLVCVLELRTALYCKICIFVKHLNMNGALYTNHLMPSGTGITDLRPPHFTWWSADPGGDPGIPSHVIRRSVRRSWRCCTTSVTRTRGEARSATCVTWARRRSSRFSTTSPGGATIASWCCRRARRPDGRRAGSTSQVSRVTGGHRGHQSPGAIPPTCWWFY